jgi:cyclopropane-fatty-acyl-phospholipid synthase
MAAAAFTALAAVFVPGAEAASGMDEKLAAQLQTPLAIAVAVAALSAAGVAVLWLAVSRGKLCNLTRLADRGLLPDFIVRLGIRRLLVRRLRLCEDLLPPEQFAEQMRKSAIALLTDAANEQHYEVPAEFFVQALGKNMNYSSCLFERPDSTLDDAQMAMVKTVIERAELADGMDILEMGCGWGAFSLNVAARFPLARVTAVSNSRSQREFIMRRAEERGIKNLEVVTADMRVFDTDKRFDRAISVEMFEHMRNWEQLLAKVSRWLRPDGKLFIHIFTHRRFAYEFLDEGEDDWMTKYFFAGGIMPSRNLISFFGRDLAIERQWEVNGTHYGRTSEAWLVNLDQNAVKARAALRPHPKLGSAEVQFYRWRIFFMAVAELFAFRGGEEWGVTHYLLSRPRRK